MRRSDKEITKRSEIDAIIDRGQVCRLAFARDNRPYIVPLCYGYDGEALFFHCVAGQGLKLDYLKEKNQVCFEIEHGVELVSHKEKPCNWSFNYQSVVGFGVAEELVEEEQKFIGLKHIMDQYSEKKWSFDNVPLSGVAVWKITIDQVSGKQSANFKV